MEVHNTVQEGVIKTTPKKKKCNMGRICLQGGRPAFYPWVGKVPWRRAGQPLQYSYLENLHGDSSLAVYSPWGREELDMTEQISTAQVAKKRRDEKGKMER